MPHPGSRRSSLAGPPPPATHAPTANMMANNPADDPFVFERQQQQQNTTPSTSQKLPMLQSTLPAAFIPLDSDITAVDDESSFNRRDRVERLRRLLDSIDHQRKGVRENLLWLFEREKERMITEAAEQEAQLQKTAPQQLQKTGTLHPSELDEVIRCMEAPYNKEVDYNMTNIPMLDTQRPLPPTLGPRDLAINRLLNLIESGTRELRGYEEHIAGIRNFYEACLMKEVARIEAAGMRPEERHKVANAETAGAAPEAAM